MSKKGQKGITVTKDEDFSEWYTQVIQKAELIEYSPVSGCYILRPNAYHIWEKIQLYFDKLIKDDGVQNAYFPLLIPESLLKKEEKHVEGFAPEVAWVETGGHTKLKERLAIRPTSETIMYDSYAKWIRSHNDLPLRLNQWCSVVRWEFKHCTPFLRSREFLWQEGHTVFATEKEAQDEVLKILHFYQSVFEDLCAVPVLLGKKSEAEKFAGANYTLSIESVMPNGKAIQGATSHQLGQNFAKAFDITFKDRHQKDQHPWQNSWGITTRSIGMLIMVHSDDKGLVLPPKIARIQVVIVPILFDDTKVEVLKEAHDVAAKLRKVGVSVFVDDREAYSPGWKYNEWELKGIPVRIELGPRDLEKKHVMVARRDTGLKNAIKLNVIEKKIPELLDTIHKDLFTKAKKFLKSHTGYAANLKDAKKALDDQNIFLAQWCGTPACEEKFKEKYAAKSLNSPLKQKNIEGKCFACSKKATAWFYFGKSY